MSNRIEAGRDRLSELVVGSTDSIRRRIRSEDVQAFADLSGDHNALHLDEEFAARTEFERPVVHGFLHASLLSALIGTKIPGRGALYLSQAIDFSKPVYVGDSLEARATVETIDSETRVIGLKTEIFNQHGVCVLKGHAKVKLLRAEPRAVPPAEPPTREQTGLLKGRTALVTGASRGIGRAVARLLATHGAKVWVNYRRSEVAARQVVDEIAAAGGKAQIIRADVGDEAEVEFMLGSIAAGEGLDILVNNAGPRIHAMPFARLPWTEMATSYDAIVGSAFRVIQHSLPLLKASRGRIINILTSAALGRTAHHWLPYVAAKGALLALSKNLAQELGPQGITVNMVSPSMVDTDLVSNVPDAIRRIMVSRTPLRRLATPDDVAGAVLLLATPYADFITGDNLLVTGGDVMV